MDKKTKVGWVLIKLLEGWSDKKIREVGNIPERTYFRWKKIINTQGHHVLMNEKKRGPKPSIKIDGWIKKKILLWRKKYGWGPTKIEGHFDKHFHVKVPHRQVYNLIVKKGLNNPIDEPRKTWGKKRFERTHSNSLWQADFKLTESDEWMITFLDDHSRFIPNSRIFNEASGKNAIKTLKRAGKKFGWPGQILTDRGAQFHNNRGEDPTKFTQFCIDHRIQHIVASKRRPTTIGKVEAFHGCYEAEAWRFSTHRKYINHWNYERPNGAIGYLYPTEVYFRDLKDCH